MTINAYQPDIVWDEIKKKYRAYLMMDGRYELLGYFQNLDDAHTARTQSAWCFVQQFNNKL